MASSASRSLLCLAFTCAACSTSPQASNTPAASPAPAASTAVPPPVTMAPPTSTSGAPTGLAQQPNGPTTPVGGPAAPAAPVTPGAGAPTVDPTSTTVRLTVLSGPGSNGGATAVVQPGEQVAMTADAFGGSAGCAANGSCATEEGLPLADFLWTVSDSPSDQCDPASPTACSASFEVTGTSVVYTVPNDGLPSRTVTVTLKGTSLTSTLTLSLTPGPAQPTRPTSAFPTW